MKTIYLFLADGFEEVEALSPVDYLRRAGAEVLLISINNKKSVTGAHGITVVTDVIATSNMPIPDMVILPGGMPGAKNLAESESVHAVVTAAMASQKYVCAICAAPAVVLGSWGLLADKKFTCYPGMQDQVSTELHAQYTADRVTIDENLITAAGPGVSEEFSFVLVSALFGESAVQKIRHNAMARC